MASCRATVLVLGLFCIMSTEAADQCHCSTSSECTLYPGGNCTACDQFWSGSNCQTYNIARGDVDLARVSQGNSNPNMVIDGEERDIPQKCTSITDQFGTTASWTLILKKKHDIYRMKITHYSGHADSLRTFEVKVGGALCKRFSSSQNPPKVLDFTCGQPLNGDLVSISIPISAIEYYELALCEVEIYECGDYWYGADCLSRCSCANTTEVCNKINGACLSGKSVTTRETTASTTTTSTTAPSTTRSRTQSESTARPADQVFYPRSPDEHPDMSKPISEVHESITLGQVAGVVIGVILAAGIVIAVAVLLFIKLRGSKRPRVGNSVTEDPTVVYTLPLDKGPGPEVDTQKNAYETLPGDRESNFYLRLGNDYEKIGPRLDNDYTGLGWRSNVE